MGGGGGGGAALAPSWFHRKIKHFRISSITLTTHFNNNTSIRILCLVLFQPFWTLLEDVFFNRPFSKAAAILEKRSIY